MTNKKIKDFFFNLQETIKNIIINIFSFSENNIRIGIMGGWCEYIDMQYMEISIKVEHQVEQLWSNQNTRTIYISQFTLNILYNDYIYILVRKHVIMISKDISTQCYNLDFHFSGMLNLSLSEASPKWYSDTPKSMS